MLVLSSGMKAHLIRCTKLTKTLANEAQNASTSDISGYEGNINNDLESVPLQVQDFEIPKDIIDTAVAPQPTTTESANHQKEVKNLE